ncbi:MAG: DUF721 domain-containing protein [Trueperaceae bacterium]|nr:DUF721 domain-containing protein [Trueperaceae bacterium]
MARSKYNRGHVSDALAEVFKRGGMKRALKRAESVLLWPQVAGSEVARFTEAKTLQDGILYVEVSDSETAMHLMMQRQRFLDVYKVKFGVKDIREIRFRVGRPAVRLEEEPLPSKPVHIDPMLLSKFARTLGDLPDNLSQPAMQAAKAMLIDRERKRAAGWLPCPLCDALSDHEGLCDTCQRYAQENKVQRASQGLAVDPDFATPFLSEDERSVAVYLAKQYLQEKLSELLPHVLADPTYKQELASIACCFVAHALGKKVSDVSEEDLDILDSRVARALGRWK